MARLELPFERIPVPPATDNSERLVVVRGDSLWNIARARYGNGFRHTPIYGANKDQIRDPDLIYPGQVFSFAQGQLTKQNLTSALGGLSHPVHARARGCAT